MEEIIANVKSMNDEIRSLQDKRDSYIHQNADTIIKAVVRKMDWDNENFDYAIEYSAMMKRIMVDVRLEREPGIRYIFEIGAKAKVELCYRENLRK